jgi:hypothetical protein
LAWSVSVQLPPQQAPSRHWSFAQVVAGPRKTPAHAAAVLASVQLAPWQQAPRQAVVEQTVSTPRKTPWQLNSTRIAHVPDGKQQAPPPHGFGVHEVLEPWKSSPVALQDMKVRIEHCPFMVQQAPVCAAA